MTGLFSGRHSNSHAARAALLLLTLLLDVAAQFLTGGFLHRHRGRDPLDRLHRLGRLDLLRDRLRPGHGEPFGKGDTSRSAGVTSFHYSFGLTGGDAVGG